MITWKLKYLKAVTGLYSLTWKLTTSRKTVLPLRKYYSVLHLFYVKTGKSVYSIVIQYDKTYKVGHS